MTLTEALLYFAAAAVAGAINSVAGGGTFLVFPMLIYNGLTPLLANIMCTIALWPGSIAGAWAYRKQLRIKRSVLARFMFISIAGSILGTATLLGTPELLFAKLVPWLLLFATLLFTFGNKLGIHTSPDREPQMHTPKGLLLQFVIAFYGGYFGAGIGILMLAMLQLLGMRHIHQMNALKTVLGSTINAVAFIMFALSGKVLWGVGFIMIAGAIAGGFLGAKISMRVSPGKVRAFVSVTGFATVAYFFMHGM